MNITPDAEIVFSNGFITINRTLVASWIVMAVVIFIAIILRLNLTSNKNISKIQSFFELFVRFLEAQIKEAGGNVGFIYIFPVMSTLFLYILVSNLISLIPYFTSPTASLSTTLALSITVVFFSFAIGIKVKGFEFLKKYIKPTPFMLPFNVIGDVSSVVSLSFRLYGNIMSSGIILTILSQIKMVAFGLPILINLLSTLTGVIQTYIFFMLSMMLISLDE